MADSSEKDRHDREGGRQLLVFSVPLAILFGFLGYRGSATAWMLAAVATGASVGVAIFPIVAIRLVSGRFAELLPAPKSKSKSKSKPKPKSKSKSKSKWKSKSKSFQMPIGFDQAQDALPSDDAVEAARAVLEARAEGTPVLVALSERWMSKARRRALGIALMVFGGAGFVAGIALASASALWEAGGALAFLGLVLWYRTL